MKFRSAPFWYDRFPSSKRPGFPRQRSRIDTRVAIVGGGLAGCSCACVLAAARIPVVLIEAERIGSGATAGATGLVREDYDRSFRATAAAHGLRTARILWQGMRRAAKDFPAALRRFGISCDLRPQDLLTVVAADRAAARAFRREYDARRDAGLDHRWMTPASVARDAAIESGGGIRTHAMAIDPYRACVGLAQAAAGRGALIFERSEARRIRANRNGVEVVTSGGTVQAGTVVIASGASISDLRALRRHLHPRHGYGVVTEPLGGPVRREVGRRTLALRDGAAPPHLVRWLGDNRVLIAGAEQHPVPDRTRKQAVLQRTGQLMYELSLLYPAISGTSPAYGWSYAFDDTVDGLPFVGPHRNFPRHLFALGLGRHGAGAAWLAARILLRHMTDERAKGDEVFGFGRIL